MITNEQCIKALGDLPEKAEWIILGEEGHELTCIASSKGVVAQVIEDDELSKACKIYLKKSGVKIFRTNEEVMEYFNWDGTVSVELS